MDKLQKLLGSLLIIGLLGGATWHWLVNVPEKRKATSTRLAMQEKEAKARFERWAYVAKAKDIGPGETIRLVIIPHPSGIDFLDTKCLIYTHTEYRSSSMQCPGAKQEDIEIENE